VDVDAGEAAATAEVVEDVDRESSLEQSHNLTVEDKYPGSSLPTVTNRFPCWIEHQNQRNVNFKDTFYIFKHIVMYKIPWDSE
jgi:hypothetical protein